MTELKSWIFLGESGDISSIFIYVDGLNCVPSTNPERREFMKYATARHKQLSLQ